MLRLIGFLVVVVAVLVGVGIWRDWIVFASADSPSGSGVRINLNETRIREDADAVGAQIRSLSQNVALRVKAVGESVGDRTILRGAVRSAGEGALSVIVDGETLDLAIGEGVEISLMGRSTRLGALGPGDRVTVHLSERGEAGLAVHRIEATRD